MQNIHVTGNICINTEPPILYGVDQISQNSYTSYNDLIYVSHQRWWSLLRDATHTRRPSRASWRSETQGITLSSLTTPSPGRTPRGLTGLELHYGHVWFSFPHSLPVFVSSPLPPSACVTLLQVHLKESALPPVCGETGDLRRQWLSLNTHTHTHTHIYTPQPPDVSVCATDRQGQVWKQLPLGLPGTCWDRERFLNVRFRVLSSGQRMAYKVEFFRTAERSPAWSSCLEPKE